MNVIVDKSWLTKIGRNKLQTFSRNKILLLIDAFGYEIFSTDQSDIDKKEQAMSLWQKLYLVRSFVKLTWGIGYFFDFEINNQVPIDKISNHYFPVNFKPSENLLDGTAVFSYEEMMALFKHMHQYEVEGVNSYKQISAGVHNYIPELRNIKVGYNREDIMFIYNKVAQDYDFVKFVYNDFRPEHFPPTKLLDQNWVIFRWLQTNLLYGIDYTRKYGVDNLEIDTPKFINTNIDINYVILGVLGDSIATFDKDLKFFYKLLYPGKKIFE